MPNVNSKKMKSALLYLNARSRSPTTRCCRIAHARNLALSGAIYTLVSVNFILCKLKKVRQKKKLKKEKKNPTSFHCHH